MLVAAKKPFAAAFRHSLLPQGAILGTKNRC